MSKLVRALTVLVDDLTALFVRSRVLVISITLLALSIVGAISLL